MTKKIPFLLLLLAGFTGLQAQVKLGGEIGFHSASVLENNSIPGWDTATHRYYSSKQGIHLGILVEIPISRYFFFQPGLQYSSKGQQYAKNFDSAGTAKTDTVYAKSKLQLGYMEIPLYLTFKLPLSANHKNNFFIGAGPYFAFMLNSSMNIQSLMMLNDTTPKYINQTNDLLIGNAVNKYKIFDAGINAKAGFEFGNVTLSGFFSTGLTSFYTAPYKSTFHHRLFGATLGVWLAKTAVPVPVVSDKDKDGIPDEEDRCPLQPGTAKYLGCPVPDTDHDGIDDEHDSCKTVKGTAKYNGCPIPDRDHDGVNDEVDKCPDTPGTAENQGCPEVKNELREKVNFVAHNILFAFKSDSLTGGSYLALDELVGVLQTHPELHLTIEGHTDSVGTPEHNKVLSQKRADAVKSYLVGKGIPENRIVTEAMGEDAPKADNGTEQGRAINRRVELKLSAH